MYLAGKSVISEHGFCDTTPTTLQEPIFAFYNWGRNANKSSGVLGNMHWPTVAPAAIRFYGQSAIPGWNYSLLIPSLKNGLFRLKLKADGLSIDSTANPTDTLHYLAGYRLRNITVAPSGDTLFVAVDNSCCTLGTSGTIGNSAASPDLGFILRMVYVTTLTCRLTPNPLPPPSRRRGSTPIRLTGPSASKAGPATESPGWQAFIRVAGQLVVTRASYEDNFTLDLGAVQPGVYILRLFSGIGAPVLIQKVLVE